MLSLTPPSPLSPPSQPLAALKQHGKSSQQEIRQDRQEVRWHLQEEEETCSIILHLHLQGPQAGEKRGGGVYKNEDVKFTARAFCDFCSLGLA